MMKWWVPLAVSCFLAGGKAPNGRGMDADEPDMARDLNICIRDGNVRGRPQ